MTIHHRVWTLPLRSFSQAESDIGAGPIRADDIAVAYGEKTIKWLHRLKDSRTVLLAELLDYPATSFDIKTKPAIAPLELKAQQRQPTNCSTAGH
jgi:hypothetical protein